MRSGQVLYKNELAGILSQLDNGSFNFSYDEQWIKDSNKPSISLTLPKSKIAFQSATLFPFFFNMLSEGVNRKLQSTQLRIDEEDNFGLLAATAQYDTIGAITVKPIVAR
jgi:serine/threonine-protein kinase HipA